MLRWQVCKLGFVLFVTGLTGPLHAAPSSACGALGMSAPVCVDPVMSEWKSWQAVIDGRALPVRDTEPAAREDAINALQAAYPCGLSYAEVDGRFNVTGSTWSWPVQEEAKRLSFVGFKPNGRECSDKALETIGAVVLRRQRTASCPKSYGWLVRDEVLAVCVQH